MTDNTREHLPGMFETKYRSEYLKEKIADPLLWEMLSSEIGGSLNSAAGKRCLRKNDVLFTFIDKYLPDGSYSLAIGVPGIFLCVPAIGRHQGIAFYVPPKSSDLMFCHYWNPSDFSSNAKNNIGCGILNTFIAPADEMLGGFVRDVFTEKADSPSYYCTFAFDMTHIMVFRDNFMDDISAVQKKVDEFLKYESDDLQRAGQYLINYCTQVAALISDEQA